MKQSLELTNPVKKPQTLVEGWIEMIERFSPYHWFQSLTFKDDLTNVRANKLFARFMREMNEDLFGKRYREKGLGLPYINARERQARGCPHFHTLIGGDCWKLERMKYKQLWEGWDEETKTFTRNGMARILPYDHNLGARWYCAKYIGKGGEIDVVIPPYMYEKYGLKESNNYSFKFVAN